MDASWLICKHHHLVRHPMLLVQPRKYSSSQTTEELNMVDLDRSGPDWEELHVKGETGWDLKGVTPALEDLLASKELNQFNIKSILVPGCGVGHDPVAFSKMTSEPKVVGLDISPTANANAKKLNAEAIEKSNGRLQFIVGDFFTLQEKFDLGYDYTFLCALHPSHRQEWAKQTANYVKSGGHLITMMFPLGKEASAGGPPFGVTQQLYFDLLAPYFDNLWVRDCRSHEKRQGNEKIALWKRK